MGQGARKYKNMWLALYRLLSLGALLCLLPMSSAMAAAVCAVVKIEIQQELTLERQAFDAIKN